jgi:parvulin-like peptidyl-prolyl isomerase
MSRLPFAVLLFAFAVAGCKLAGQDQGSQSGLPFDLGSPVSNPSIAAVVESSGTADTLGAERFKRNLDRLNSMFPDVMSDPEQEASIRREIVKQFVVEELLIAESDRRGVGVYPATVEARLAEYRNSFDSDEDYRSELDRFGQTEDELRDQFRIELVRASISNVIEQETAAPSSQEVETFRESMAERLLTQHMLFMFDETMSGEEQEAVKVRAAAVLDSALSGVNFGSLARRHSDDAGTAQAGGELPWFRRGEMVEEFEKAAFELANSGDITDHLVETTYGYHVIRLVDRKRDDPMPVDVALGQLTRQKVRKAERDLIESLQRGAVVRVNADLIPGFVD